MMEKIKDASAVIAAVLFVLALGLLSCWEVEAQTTKYFSDHGTLTISPDSVSYAMVHRSASFPNHALSELPLSAKYQWASHDLGLLVGDLNRKGVDVIIPQDSLREVIDSLYTEVANLILENDQLANTISQQAADIQDLEIQLIEAEEEKDYAITRIREIMQIIREN